jgi:hypothetical protein
MNQIVMDDLTKKMDAHQKHKLEKIFWPNFADVIMTFQCAHFWILPKRNQFSCRVAVPFQ